MDAYVGRPPVTVRRTKAVTAVALGLSVFGVAVLLLLATTWHLIVATGPESGDFALYSILVQQAKHFRLLAGNPSRVGFHHPGPALLYVLAAGEGLFHDTLKWVAPIGGQIMAGEIYDAAWLGLAAFLLRRIGASAGCIVVTLSVAVAFLTLQEKHIFDSVWFPFLYVLPFLTFVVALAAAVAGDGPAWIAIGLTMGFLVNGHVSFVGICGVAILSVVIAAVAARRVPSWRWPLVGAGVFGLFLVPLAILEVKQRPGPIEQYAAFAGANSPHGIAESAVFLSQRIGATAIELLAAAVAIAMLAVRWRERFYGAMLVAVAGVGLGAFYYTVKGVDFLTVGNAYVIYFFGSVTGLVFGVATYDALCRGRSAFISALVAVAALAFWVVPLRSDKLDHFFNDPSVAEIDRALPALGPEKVSLSLLQAHDFTTVWERILGVEAARARAKHPLGFCIASGWQLANGEAARCTEADGENQQFTVDVAGASAAAKIQPALTAGGLDFLPVPCLSAGEAWTARADPIAIQGAMFDGWSILEGPFAWSLGHRATLNLCLDRSVQAVDLDLNGLVGGTVARQRVTALVDGREVASLVISDPEPGHRLRVLIPDSHPRNFVILLDLPDAISPASLGGSSDTRVLGIGLHGLAAE